MSANPYTKGQLIGLTGLEKGWNFGETLSEQDAAKELDTALGLPSRGDGWLTSQGYVIRVEGENFAEAIYRTHDGEYRRIKWRRK